MRWRGPRGTYTYLAHYYAGAGAKEVVIEVRKGEQVVDRKAFVLRRVGESSPAFTYSH